MTMVVRDEADILEATLDYHYRQGIDLVLAIDHRSADETPDILARYAAEGRLQFDRVEEEFEGLGTPIPRGQWVTRLARRAATEFDADWVINNDADEFWWPVEGTLKEMFAKVPPGFDVLAAPRLEFLPRPDDGAFFAERMVVRETRPRVKHKVAHRAQPDITVSHGGHSVEGGSLRPVRTGRRGYSTSRSAARRRWSGASSSALGPADRGGGSCMRPTRPLARRSSTAPWPWTTRRSSVA